MSFNKQVTIPPNCSYTSIHDNEKFNEMSNNTQIEKVNQYHSYTVFDLLKYKSQRGNFLILCYIWFVSSMVFYGLSINIKNLSNEIYLNGIIIFSLDIIFILISGFITNTEYFGRRKTIIILFILSLITFVLSFFLKNQNDNLFNITMIMSRLSYSCIFCIVFYVSNEVYPTVLRAKGLAYNSGVCRLGAIIAPFIIEMINIKLLLVIFSIINVMGILLSILLTETHGKPLRNNIPELDADEDHE